MKYLTLPAHNARAEAFVGIRWDNMMLYLSEADAYWLVAELTKVIKK